MKNLTNIRLMPFEKPDYHFISNNYRDHLPLLINNQQKIFIIKNITKPIL